MTVQGVTDLAGNLTPATTSRFITGVSTRFNPPLLLQSDPVSDAVIPTNTAAFSFTFDEAIDPANLAAGLFTVQDRDTWSNLPGVISQSVDGKTIRFAPAQPLSPGDSVSVAMNNLTDLAGNVSGYNSVYYTVGNSAANLPLSVAASNPEPNWKNVPPNVNLQVLFSAMPDLTTLSGIQLFEGSVPIALTPIAPAPNGQGGPSSVALQTASLLHPNSTYTLVISGVRDVAGNPLAKPLTIPFTTGPAVDLTSPVVTLVSPVNPNSTGPRTLIRVHLSSPLNPVSMSVYFVDANYNNVPVNFSVSSDGLTATWTPVSPLSQGTYMFSFGGLDDAGNVLEFPQTMIIVK